MDATLEQTLRTQSVDAILKHPPKATTLKRVDFSRLILSDTINTQTYQIMLSHEMSGAPAVAVLFPNHAKQQLIWSSSYRSLSRWSKALNDALSNSLDETEESGDAKLCVAHGKHIYVCQRFTGRIYLFWAHVHRGNAVLGTQMPVLINTDAKLQPKAIMVLHPRVEQPSDAERIPITHASPLLKWDWKRMAGHPFVCDERRTSALAIPTAQRMQEARYDLTRTAISLKEKPLLMHNQFARSLDCEDDDDDDDSGVTVNLSSGDDLLLINVERGEGRLH